MESNYEKLLRDIVTAIVSFPEKIRIEKTTDEKGVLLKLWVDPKDMGKVIGREGATGKAIRTLLHSAGSATDARVSLKIEEPEGSAFRKPEPHA